jgi:Xaa-Pro aminopeptidase
MRLISRKKIEAVSERLKRLGIDAAVFVNREPLVDSSIAYLTGFSGMLNGVLILRAGSMHLLTTQLDHERALDEASVDEVLRVGKKENAKDAIKPLLSGAKNIGVIKNGFTLGAMSKLGIAGSKLVDIEKTMREERAVKEAREIEAIKKSAAISNSGVRFLQGFIERGMRENEVAAGLERELKANGSERTPFDTIVTSGRRSCIVHPYPASSGGRIGNGLGLVDFGAVYHGYVTDVTVPFMVGKGTAKEVGMAETVLSTFDEVVKKIKDGASTEKVSGAYEGCLRKKGFQAKHSLGHGIGLDTHDSPSFTEAGGKLLKNMTLAVEPGVYMKGIGGCRLENDLLVTSSGCNILTKSKLIRI